MRRGIAMLGTLGAGLTIALTFVLTLALDWPLTTFGPRAAIARDVTLVAPSGTLAAGRVARVAWRADGWPLALGPLDWKLAWPGQLALTLGEGHGAWHARGAWHGLDTRWTITGGDLDALDLSRLPLALAARWEGQLDITLRGTRCLASHGALTASDLVLLTPTRVALGHARLQFACRGGAPQLRLNLEQGQDLALSLTLKPGANGGQGELRGRIADSHPLAEWRRRLDPSASGERLERHFRW
ncbi:type II secretion system protein N [Salinicola sp. CR57]|uniref:type II secretion system protein N n=1 Tax=Salinicola sp. CR57 TaxID=1949086 RepID=UPI000DA1CBF9|nr:type II secretion system protein N [Salinicola sp. CR57]